MLKTLPFIILISLFFFVVSCNDPSGVGSDLVLEDRVNFNFTDELQVSMRTVLEDSVRVYDNRLDVLENTRYYFGRSDDHLFGVSRSSIYAQLIPTSYSPEFAPSQADDNVYTIDSIILTLRYVNTRPYGQKELPVGMEVFELKEILNQNRPAFSNAAYETGDLLGASSFVPKPNQNVMVDTIVRDPHVRIPLDNELGQRLLDLSSSDYITDLAFIEAFNGIYLSPTDETNSLVAFNFFNTLSGITLYYSINGESTNTYRLAFNRLYVLAPNFQNDYSGTPVETSLNAEDLKAEKYYLQGLGGVNIAITFDNLEILEGSIINKAEIEFGVAQENINSVFPPPNQLLLAEWRNDDFAAVRDVTASLNTGNPNPFYLFGGSIQRFGNDNPDAVVRLPETSGYKMNITGALHDLLMNRVEDNTIYLRVSRKFENSARTIIAGPGHPEFAPRVSVYYTPLD